MPWKGRTDGDKSLGLSGRVFDFGLTHVHAMSLKYFELQNPTPHPVYVRLVAGISPDHEMTEMLLRYANHSQLSNVRAARQNPPYFDDGDVGQGDFWLGPNATQALTLTLTLSLTPSLTPAEPRHKPRGCR